MSRLDLTAAKLAGREAGRLELAAALNPYPAGSVEAVTWETERLQLICERTLARAKSVDRSDS